MAKAMLKECIGDGETIKWTKPQQLCTILCLFSSSKMTNDTLSHHSIIPYPNHEVPHDIEHI